MDFMSLITLGCIHNVKKFGGPNPTTLTTQALATRPAEYLAPKSEVGLKQPEFGEIVISYRWG